jgi:hypothetical protein
MSFLRCMNVITLMTLVSSAFAMNNDVADPYLWVYHSIYEYHKPGSSFKKDILRGAPVYGKALDKILKKYPNKASFQRTNDQEKKKALLIYDAWNSEKNMTNEGKTNIYARLSDQELLENKWVFITVFSDYQVYAMQTEKLEKFGLKEDDSTQGYTERLESLKNLFKQNYPAEYKVMMKE